MCRAMIYLPLPAHLPLPARLPLPAHLLSQLEEVV